MPFRKRFPVCICLTICKDRVFLSELLASVSCLDVIPESGKIVIIDTCISLKVAFQAMMENGTCAALVAADVATDIRCAPLWDSSKKDFVGLMTLSDFINILRFHYAQTPPGSRLAVSHLLEGKKIIQCKGTAKLAASDVTFVLPDMEMAKAYRELLTIRPEDHLFNAAKRLVYYKIHRMPLQDPRDRSVVGIVTHSNIVHHLMSLLPTPRPLLFGLTLGELRIGKYDDLVYVQPVSPQDVWGLP